MDSNLRLANAITRKAAKVGAVNAMYYGVWVAAESADSNLSQVQIPGADLDGGDLVLRFVPKLAHVTGLATSSTVLCLGSPLCIIGVVSGNIELASI